MYRKIILSTLSFLVLVLALAGYGSGGTVAKATSTLFNSPLPTPIAEFYYDLYDPSIYDTVNFWDASADPLGYGFASMKWDFGDGTTSTSLYYAAHKYAADGDYTVTHKVETTDGRSATVSRVISVRTRDVSILKFARPKDGRVGQVRKFIVGINSKLQAETVRVDIYKTELGAYDGFRQIGSWEQVVPVQSGKKTTDFIFVYTFSEEDARLGKVNFKAVASIVNGRDAAPADNAYITLPVTVKAATGRSETAVLESEADLLIDDVANGDAIPVFPTDEQAQNQRVYIPFAAAVK